MDENQIAEVKAAIEKARASGNVADAEALEGYLKQNLPESTVDVVKDKVTAPESSLIPALGGATGAIFGGGKVAEKLAAKSYPYDVNAPKSAAAPSAAAQRQFVSPEAVKARVEGRPLTPAPTPSVSVQGISDADLAARKTPGASASVNYGKVMAGQTMPDVVANEIQTMDKVNPKGAYQVAARDAANLEKIKAIGEGGQKLMNVGGTQLMLPESATKEMLSEQAAAEKAAKDKSLQEAASKRSASAQEAAKLRAERMAEVEKLKGTPGAKAAEKFAKLKSTLEVPQKYLTKAGEVMHIATSPLTTNLALRGLTGFGAGMGIDEAAQRWQQGQKGRAIVSGLGAAGDIAAMTRHPGAMAVGTVAGVGAPLLNTYLDKWAAEHPEAAEKLGLKAGGSVAGYADGGAVDPTAVPLATATPVAMADAVPVSANMVGAEQVANPVAYNLGNPSPLMTATGMQNPTMGPLSSLQQQPVNVPRFAGPQNQLRAGQPRPAPTQVAPNASFLQNLLRRGRYFR